jgi:hypothetical protein
MATKSITVKSTATKSIAKHTTNSIKDPKNLSCENFLSYLHKLEALITKSSTQKNAGLYLYNNDARTIAFMLEALSRFYKSQHNKKRFTKMLEKFKVLEDSIGQIDYFDNIAKETGKTANDVIVKKHSSQQALHHASILHAHIAEKWTGKKSNFIKIKEKLNSANWQDTAALDAGIKTFYAEEIAKIKELIANCTYTNMETDVHEIRRKLRWLSIYPQALQGKIQLLKDAKPLLKYKPYMSKEVLSSPYNKMPLKGKHATVVQLYAPAYYALSFVIAALGDIKDKGLTQTEYTSALVAASNISPAQAKIDSEKTLGAKSNKEATLLAEAKNICTAFIKTGALDALVVKK